jgi:putative peptidoglycan lipid II flippase
METGPSSGLGESIAVARNSVTVAAWILVSRVTGLLRVATIAAILGPTYFGNLFQATNLLPNLTFELLTGTLFSSLLVPALVRHVDANDRPSVERLVGGFLSFVLATFGVITFLLIALRRPILALLTVAVPDEAVRQQQQRVGWLLLALLLPQVMLYAVAGVGAAVQHAHGRFGRASFPPALENIGVIVTLLLAGAIYGTGTPVESVTVDQVLLIGLGTTGAVGLHAVAQWWGARRVGVRLRPRRGWRTPDVQRVIRLLLPSMGFTALNVVRFLGVLIVAGTVPGGLVAFQIAIYLYNLPVALSSYALAPPLLARLARLHHVNAASQFHQAWIRGMALVLFLAIPSAIAYVVLARPISLAISFGEMASPRGVELVTVSLAAIGLGVIGHAAWVLGAQAAYASNDAHSVVVSMIVRTAITLAGMAIALSRGRGTSLLVALGLSITVGDIVGASHLSSRLRSKLTPSGEPLMPSLAKTCAASWAMVVPAHLIAARVESSIGGRGGQLIGVGLAVVAGGACFLVLQLAWRSPELNSLLAAFGGGRSGGPKSEPPDDQGP